MTEFWTFSFSSLRNEVQSEEYVSYYIAKCNNTVVEITKKDTFFFIQVKTICY